MPKRIFATLACAALASEEVEFDAGLSLLQTRAQKIDIDQEPTYFTKGMGEVCDHGEDLTLAQCLEVQYTKKDVPNGEIEPWGILPNSRSHSGWKMPKGCFMAKSTRMAWNDQPLGFPVRHYRPICSKQGGREAEIASQGSSCKEPTCAENPLDQRLNWEGDGVVVPEFEVGELGAVCDPSACLLNYAQCAKAGDTAMFEVSGYNPRVTGALKEFKYQPTFETAGHTQLRPGSPSGCYTGPNYAQFSPYDTPDGALAGPGGTPLVSDSGVGVGYKQYRPICGVCPTTTTPPPPPPPPVDEPEGDAAAAVADPHMATNTGKHYTLSDA